MKLNYVATSVTIFALAACSPSSHAPTDTPQAATGDTPIRYVICASDGTHCFVAARFNDFDGCESHKKWSGMLCDSNTVPGQMDCREDREKLATAYCTK